MLQSLFHVWLIDILMPEKGVTSFLEHQKKEILIFAKHFDKNSCPLAIAMLFSLFYVGGEGWWGWEMAENGGYHTLSNILAKHSSAPSPMLVNNDQSLMPLKWKSKVFIDMKDHNECPMEFHVAEI